MIFSHNDENAEVKRLSIKQMREKCGMTQNDLAEKLGLDQSTVCLWETGKTQPRTKLLPKIAELFNCTVDELLASDAPTD